jgi:hypothetical protein
MVQTPFRTSFDPNDGTWLWVTASPYNATGNGSTDDASALASCISAAVAAGKGVYLPAGTYLISSTLTLPSNLTMRGAGDTTIFTRTAQASWRHDGLIYIFDHETDSISNFHISYCKFAQSSYLDSISSLRVLGAQNCSAKYITFENVDVGLKTGSSATIAHGWDVDHITATACFQPMFLACTHDSVFSNLDLDVPYTGIYEATAQRPHTIYMERDLNTLTFSNCVFKRGRGYTVCMYNEGDVTGSANITFNNTIIDDSAGRNPLNIQGVGWTNIIFNGLVLTGNSSTQADPNVVINAAVTGVEFHDVVSSGGDYLIGGTCDGTILFHEGTHSGIGMVMPGSTLPNLTNNLTAP